MLVCCSLAIIGYIILLVPARPAVHYGGWVDFRITAQSRVLNKKQDLLHSCRQVWHSGSRSLNCHAYTPQGFSLVRLQSWAGSFYSLVS